MNYLQWAQQFSIFILIVLDYSTHTSVATYLYKEKQKDIKYINNCTNSQQDGNERGRLQHL